MLVRPATLRYPDEAPPEAHGTTRVRVWVRPDGTVERAEMVDGPVGFHPESLRAAGTLLFEPFDGDASRVAVVVFHFAPPEDAVVSDDELEEVVVHAGDPDRESMASQHTIDDEAIARTAGLDLANTVAKVAGATVASGSADVSKPILRGQPERRLLVLVDGVRHEGQKWGADHGTEVDPFSAGAITVVRGAAGARFGPDAIGGVLQVDAPPMRDTPGVGGRAALGFSSNGLRPFAALRLDGQPAKVPGLSLRLEGNAAVGAAREAPAYVLGNTASRVWNLGAAVQYAWRSTVFTVRWRHHDLVAGAFYGNRIATPEGLRDSLTRDIPQGAENWTRSYDIERPYQDVEHDTVMAKAASAGTWGAFEATYAFQLNRRREFDTVRTATGPQFDFTLRTHSLEASWRHSTVHRGPAVWAGGLGVQGQFQENVYDGLPLLPNHRAFGFGLYGWERASLGRADLEIAARYDHLTRTAFFTENDFSRHVRRGTLDESACDVGDPRTRCPSGWDTGSVAVGALVHVVPEHVDLKLDLSSASRFPSPDEQYLIGTSPSLPVYALGAPDLGVETTWGGTLTLGMQWPWIHTELSGYGAFIDDYIAFVPEVGDDGEVVIDVLSRGAFPRFRYEAVDATTFGAEATLSVAPDWWMGLEARGALVRIQPVGSMDQIVGTPSDRMHLELIGRPPDVGPSRGLEIGVSAELVRRQDGVDPRQDLAPTPEGYVLVGARADASFDLRGRTMRAGIEVHNLLNTAYRDVTSLLRYTADSPGRDVRLRLSFDF